MTRTNGCTLALLGVVVCLATGVVGCADRTEQPGQGVIEANASGEIRLVDAVDMATVASPLVTRDAEGVSLAGTCLEGAVSSKEHVVGQNVWRFAPEYTTPISECWYAILPPDALLPKFVPCADVLRVERGGEAVEFHDRSYTCTIGFKYNELFPELGSVEYWGDKGEVVLDVRRTSVGVDFHCRRRIVEAQLDVFALYGRDASRRVRRDDLAVYCSDDNLHYRPVEGWSYRRKIQGKRHTIVISDINSVCRYLKIHTKHEDEAAALGNKLQEMVSVVFEHYPVGRWFVEGRHLYVSVPESGGGIPPAPEYVVVYVVDDARGKAFSNFWRVYRTLKPALPPSPTTPVANVLAKHIKMGKEMRDVLLAAVPGRLTYKIRVPPDAVLSFGYGVLPTDKAASRGITRFAIRITPEAGDSRQVFQTELDLKKPNLERWFDTKIDLSEFATGVVDVTLSTNAEEVGGPVNWCPVWSEPVVTATDAGEKTSVIMLTVCTLRADHLGCYGYPRATSPNIDEYAADGVLFEHAQTQWPQTEPSFTAIHTAAYPPTTGLKIANRQQFPRHMRTLAELFRQNGYATGAVIYNSAVSQVWGFDRGFSSFAETWGKEKKVWTAKDTTEHALAWLSRNEHRPKLFLWVLYADPHLPYTPPAPYDELFVNDDYYDGSELVGDAVNKRAVGGLVDYNRLGDHREKDYYISQYDGEIAFMDASMQPLLQAIDRVSRGREHLLAFVADHGESMGEHNYYFAHGTFTYEPTLHVPLFFRGSGPILKGERVTEPVAVIDVAPTLLEFAGIKKPSSYQGHSLLDRLREKGAAVGGKAYSEGGFKASHQQVIREDDWKLILVRDPETRKMMKNSPAELYNLASDPGEMQNLADKHPDRVKKMGAEISAVNSRSLKLLKSMSKTAKTTGETSSIRPGKVDQDVIDQLKALGYLR